MKGSARTALGRGLRALVSSAPTPVTGMESKSVNATETPSAEGSTKSTVISSGAVQNVSQGGGVELIDVDLITQGHTQPRQDFKEAELNELASSIKTNGILQPILLRKSHQGVREPYEIVAGERRWRAALIAGLQKVPAIIREFTDREALEIGLIENLQRENLNPVEEANAYKRLGDEFSLTQQEIAERVGKDRASVANIVRILSLPGPVLELISSRKLTVGHAKAILTIKEQNAQLSLAKKVAAEDLSVRELESIVSRVVVLDAGKRPASEHTQSKGKHRREQFPEVTDRLRAVLGTKVSIRHKKSGGGRIEIEYFSEQELDRLVDHICYKKD